QQKVVVGRWLQRDPAVLLLDEPTRGVDVGAREEIYQLIRRLVDEGRAGVLISSDLPEGTGQSDRIGVFRARRLAALMPAGAAAALPEGAHAESDVQRPSRGTAARFASFLHAAWTGLHLHALGLFVVAFFVAMHLATGRFLQADSLAGRANDAALLGVCAL